MISKRYIFKEIKKIEKLFNEAIRKGDIDLQNFYSKLALLELCGWIEESMDDVVARAKKKLKEQKNVRIVEEIIENNYSFEYKNLKKMLIRTIGIIEVERIERKINIKKKIILESDLANLRFMRDEHAHTYIYGATTKLYAPSVTKNYFTEVYAGLKEVETKLIRR